MAYAALVITSKVIDQILSDYKDHSLCPKLQLMSLQVLRLQKFLEGISVTTRTSSIDDLETRIRCIAYKLEDMVEYILLLLQLERAEAVESEDNNNPLSILASTADVFAGISNEVDILLEESIPRRTIRQHSIRPSPSVQPTDTIVGLDDNLKELLDWISGHQTELQTIPVTGMGGIGKTTLARAVYESPKANERFDLKLWATVSQEYDVESILRKLSRGKKKAGQNDGKEDAEEKDRDENLVERVHKRLYGRRYLIVLDDVWDEKVWDGVRKAFPDNKNSSRIILTTRNVKVAAYVGGSSSDMHQMQLLKEEQSWDLFREKVYGAELGSEFEDIGKRIARNCKGLPLAVVVIAGQLKFNMTKDYWEEVAEDTSAIDDSLLRVLSLSYTNLPPHLKSCFLHMGSFKEDEAIETKELLRLWSAEGFLKPRESKTMEEIAEECLEELVDRSLVSVQEKMYNGRIKFSSVHDALRDFILHQAQKEKFLYHDLVPGSDMDEVTFHKIVTDQRRVRFFKYSPSIKFLSGNNCDVASIRSFRSECIMNSYDPSTFAHLKLLRVLGRVHIVDNSSLSVFSRLTNLRYLGLVREVHSGPLVLPESISKLRNLETLVVYSGTYYHSIRFEVVLPLQIWEMPRLRTLVTENDTRLPIPALCGDCSNLENLSGIVDFDFTKSAIERMANMKTLQIVYRNYDKVANKQFRLDNLVHLHNLEELKIIRDDRLHPVVTDYTFPDKLKRLSMVRTRFPLEKMSIIGSLEHLEVLELLNEAVEGKVWEPVEGEFLELKCLTMESLEIDEWIAEYPHFPCLETLVIERCKQLKEVPAEIGEIDTLTKLTAKDNSNSVNESVQRIKEAREECDDVSLQVTLA